jgi:S1-C subfamily serine protease
MRDCPVAGGAGAIRRLRARLVVLLLAAAGIAGEAVADSAVARAGTEAAAWGAAGALAYHATVVNGAITGSSFQIADGIALTNAHVIGGMQAGADVDLVIATEGHPLRARARILAISPRMDLAVLAVGRGLMPVAPSGGAAPRPGSAIRAAGVVAEPQGPGQRMELAGAIASGRMQLRAFGPGVIAALPGIRRGFSGGPVVDSQGRLVGMIAALRPQPDAAGGRDGTAGREAYILTVDAIRTETARLLGEISAR